MSNNEANPAILNQGQVFKNYKALCEYMNWKVYKIGSNSQKAQFKILNTICKWHKEGRKFVIDDVYQEKKQKVDNRANNKGSGKKSIYYQDFEIIMLKLLDEERTDCLKFTITQLMQMVGMVNDDYKKYQYAHKTLSTKTSISEEEINQFYEVHQKLLTQGARTCLNTLKKAYLVHLTEITMLRCFEEKELKSGKAKRIYQDREATKEEIKNILIEKRNLMEKLECKDMNEVFRKRLNYTFYQELRKTLEKKYKISFDYTCYSVVLNKEAITKELEEIKQIVDLEELRYSINTKSYHKSVNDYSAKVVKRLPEMLGGFNHEANTKLLSKELILL